MIAKLVKAARPLFAERGPAGVPLREIAEAADVNYGLIHHYVGTKNDLLAIVLRQASEDWATQFAEAATVHDAISILMRPKSSEYARIIAHALLEGADPASMVGRSPALSTLSRRMESEIDGSPNSETESRVLVAAMTGMAMGWGLFGPFVRELAGLHEQAEDETTDAVYALLRSVVDAPPPVPGTSAD